MVQELINYFPIDMNQMLGELFPDPRPADAEANMEGNDDAAAENDAGDGDVHDEDESEDESVWSDID